MEGKITSVKKIVTVVVVWAVLAPVQFLNAEKPSAVEGTRVLSEEEKILHVLNRLGFGPRPGDIEKVKSMGLQKYIDQQLNPATIDDSVVEEKIKSLEVVGMKTAEIFAKYPNPQALRRQLDGRSRNRSALNSDEQNTDQMTQDERRERRQKIAEVYQKYDFRPASQIVPQIVANRLLRAVYSERQLQEVMVDFWQNHFNVFAGKGLVRWYIPSYERDVLRKHALGNFKDLVIGTAQHPAMLFYLDNFESISPNAQAFGDSRNIERLQQIMREGGRLNLRLRERVKQRTGLTDEQLDRRMKESGDDAPISQQRRRRGINENYARELMELHTLGVDGGYTQKDIIEVAKCFTGWTIADPRGVRRIAAVTNQGSENRSANRLQRFRGMPDDVESGEFYFNPLWHERGPKTVLGQKIDEGGVKDGLKVIDLLVSHPSTAKFIAKKLAVKFVSDTPSNDLVNRVAAAFRTSKGDIKTTLKALFTDKEFFAPENYRAKIKSPFELAVSAMRALDADTNAGPTMLAMLNKLGEVPYGYQAPTGYPDTANDWVNTGALLERFNFSIAIASNRIPGTRVDLKPFESTDKAQILGRSIAMLLNGEISPATKSMLLKQIEQPLPEVKAGNDLADDDMGPSEMRDAQRVARNRQVRLLEPSGNPEVFKIVSLVLGTPEFQRQ